MNLTTATPAEIDAKLADLYYAEGALEAKVSAAMVAIHRGLGERLQTTGHGRNKRESWPTTDLDALAAMQAKGDTLIGMMRTAASIVAKYDDAVAELAANRADQAPLSAEFARRGGWARFFQVDSGHIHRSMNCSTCHRGKERTRFGWLTEMSGRDEADAITELAQAAHILCTVCFPNAPVARTAPAPTAAEKAAAREAAARNARTEDPKLIADVDGSPLRVDGSIVRTVRTAEIKAVDALWWAAHSRHQGSPNEAYAARHDGYAHKIAAALAHKNGTTAADELVRITAKAVKKIRKDMGVSVAAAAAAHWAVQADAADGVATAAAIESLADAPEQPAAPNVDDDRIHFRRISRDEYVHDATGVRVVVGSLHPERWATQNELSINTQSQPDERTAIEVAADRAARTGRTVYVLTGPDGGILSRWAAAYPSGHVVYLDQCAVVGEGDESIDDAATAIADEPEQQHAGRDSDAALDTLIDNARADIGAALDAVDLSLADALPVVAGRVFARTQGMAVSDDCVRFRMVRARAGERVVDVLDAAGAVLGAVDEACGGWIVRPDDAPRPAWLSGLFGHFRDAVGALDAAAELTATRTVIEHITSTEEVAERARLDRAVTRLLRSVAYTSASERAVLVELFGGTYGRRLTETEARLVVTAAALCEASAVWGVAAVDAERAFEFEHEGIARESAYDLARVLGAPVRLLLSAAGAWQQVGTMGPLPAAERPCDRPGWWVGDTYVVVADDLPSRV